MNGERAKGWVVLVGAVLAGLAAVACGGGERAAELDTRTFEIMHLEDWVAEQLVAPYVYDSRPGAPGVVTVVDGKMTVRETGENLERIESTLAEFDRPKPVVRLAFQIIEANGSQDVDPRIADVESALRQLFRFEGYRLIGEVMVHATEGTELFQEFTVEELDGPAAIESVIRNVRTSSSGGSVQMEVRFHVGGHTVMGTSVRVRAGQTAVLGRTPGMIGGRHLILAVRPELIDIQPYK
jgi:hypothetical protein